MMNEDELLNDIDKLLSILNGNERKVVTLYFGLENEQLKQGQIGELMGINNSSVNHILRKAIIKMRMHAVQIGIRL